MSTRVTTVAFDEWQHMAEHADPGNGLVVRSVRLHTMMESAIVNNNFEVTQLLMATTTI